jgi:sphingolipid delta-4 desaturase
MSKNAASSIVEAEPRTGLSPEALWHFERQRRILSDHPEVRTLQGPWRGSIALIVFFTLWQCALAVLVQRIDSWPVAIIGGYLIGPIGAHALGVLIHECAHNLVAKTTWANKLWGILANFTLGLPGAMQFRHQHLLHHKYLGEVDGRDTQAPMRKEAEIIHGAPRKLFSFAWGHFLYGSRPANKTPVDGWFVLNILVVALVWPLFIWVGWKSVVFLSVGAFHAFGIHPVGGRRLSEHLSIGREQPTISYYGPFNAVLLNVGYHVEHHDIPAVPWIHLRKLRTIAARHYDGLWSCRSWTRLLFDYFFDDRYRVDQYCGMGGHIEPETVKALLPPMRRAKRSPSSLQRRHDHAA